MSRFFLTILVLFFAKNLLAQQPKALGVVVANVFGGTAGKPLDGATVKLLALTPDEGQARTAITQAGRVEFWNLPLGYYSLTITYIGYTKFTIDSIHLRPERFDFNLGDLHIIPGEIDSSTVVVHAEKPLVENRDGKLTYNVGESALNNGASTAELLRNMPLVSTDPNGKMLLKGKEPRILIDDKPVELSGQQLTDLLESLGGGNVERIEILQNPPPQYASEPGGVINIVTKRGRVGLTGKATVSAGTRGEANSSVSFTFRNAKVNFNASVSNAIGRILGASESVRTNFFPDSSNQLRTSSAFTNKYLRPNFRVQLDFDASKHHQWSGVVQANINAFGNTGLTQFNNLNRNSALWRLSRRSNDTEGANWLFNPQLSYRYRAKNPQHFVQVIAAIGWGNLQSERDFYQRFLDPVSEMPITDSGQNQQTNNGSYNHSLRINYNLPLVPKRLVLTTGVATVQNTYNNVLNAFLVNKATGQSTPWQLLNNDIRFVQKVETARLGLVFDLKKGWRITSQVQLEQTNLRFSFTKLAPSSNRYTNLLPSATIRKDISQRVNLSLLYRKTIRRPVINELNPAVDYNDPYNLRFGNPLLEPSFAHNFDLNFGYNKGKQYFNASAGYNLVGNIVNSIRTLQPDGKTLVTYQNIATKNEIDFNVFGGYAVSKKLRLNASSGLTYNQYAAADRAKLGYRNGVTSYFSTNYNVIISTVFTIDGNFKLSSFADAQGRARSNVAMNFGVQHKFFARRLVVALNLTDPFLPQRQRTTTSARNFLLESFNQNRTKNLRLALSWAFSAKPKSGVLGKPKPSPATPTKKLNPR